MLPRELTVSTRSSAGCAAASMASRMAFTSDATPVDVSLCTTVTARYACRLSLDSRS